MSVEVRHNFSELAGFHKHPRQLEAVRSMRDHKYLFYGGAKGGGKSHWLRWSMVLLLLYYYQTYKTAARVMIACETYRTLEDRQIVKVRSEFPPWLGTYNGEAKEFRLSKLYGGGVICFRNLDDPQKFNSSEYAAIGVDEAPLNAKDVFNELHALLRYPPIPAREYRILMTGNPVGAGLGHIKKRFIPGYQQLESNENPDDYAFVQAFAKDNPFNPEGYTEQILGRIADVNMRRAYLEGDWDCFEGQFFPMWRREIHVCDPFHIPKQATRYLALDWGMRAPAAVGWYALLDGFLYLYRELYVTGLVASELGREILAMTPADERLQARIADPSIWNKSPLAHGKSIGSELLDAGVAFIPGDHERKIGWARVKEWLKPFDEVDPVSRAVRRTAQYQVFSTCRDTIRTYPNVIYDDKGDGEDLDTAGEDHCQDRDRYLMMHLQDPNKLIRDRKAREQQKILTLGWDERDDHDDEQRRDCGRTDGW